MEGPKSSIPIRECNLPQKSSCKRLLAEIFASAWTVAAELWTMFLWSGSGDRSNMRMCTYKITRACQKREQVLPVIFSITTLKGRTSRSAIKRPTKCIMQSKRRSLLPENIFCGSSFSNGGKTRAPARTGDPPCSLPPAEIRLSLALSKE